MTTLSKSKYLVGKACVKRLWLETRRRDLIPPTPPTRERVFARGREVGRLARERFPGGVLVSEDPLRWRAALEETAEALARGARILFEPCFLFDDTIARADVLCRNEDGSFDLYEVKSNTGTKAEHVLDLAVQAYVYEGSGLAVRRAFLMHLNSDCRYPDLSDLFASADLTDRVRRRLPEVPVDLAAMKAALESDDEPEIRLGSRCSTPYDCPFFSYCGRLWGLPDPSVFDIPHLPAEKRDELIERGILSLDEVPADAVLGPRGGRFLRLYRSGAKDIDVPGIRDWLDGLSFPIRFLDFETDAPAIPRLEGLGPYGALPFQFSLHALREDGVLEEAPGFLHEDASDPRPAIARALLDQLGASGTIVAYNASFEKSVIGKLAEGLPELGSPLRALQGRFADLLDVFRDHYLDPAFKGSNSIKRVLPVICPGLGYEGLEVGNGEDAQAAWAELIATEDPERKAGLAKALRIYCGLDTLAMARIHGYLRELVDGTPPDGARAV
jgi:hypothetical protein